MHDNRTVNGRFLLLLALRDGPKHGYQIARYLDETSGGYFTLSHGALYPILHRLEKDKLVSATWTAAGPTRKKKVYALTKRGQRALDEEHTAYETYAAALARLIERTA